MTTTREISFQVSRRQNTDMIIRNEKKKRISRRLLPSCLTQLAAFKKRDSRYLYFVEWRMFVEGANQSPSPPPYTQKKKRRRRRRRRRIKIVPNIRSHLRLPSCSDSTHTPSLPFQLQTPRSPPLPPLAASRPPLSQVFYLRSTHK